ncbi:MAG: HVO_0649 family zinc finger protein [Haloferacaceae archaeon]
MAATNNGASAFESLRSHYETAELTCPECGHEDDDGKWQARTTGDRVSYRHVCPACGAIDVRELRLG